MPLILTGVSIVYIGQIDHCPYQAGVSVTRFFFPGWMYPRLTAAQVQTILSDYRCQDLWKLLQSAQNSEIITNQDVVRYRREAERHVGQDDHLYALQWVSPESKGKVDRVEHVH